MKSQRRDRLIRAAVREVLIDSLEPRRMFADVPQGFGESLHVEGLTSPTAMAFAPDGRLFVAEKGGSVRVVSNGSLLATPFVTVATSTFYERGLGGLVFDPDFESNHYVYLYYTAEHPQAHNRISRFTASGDVAVPGSEQVIFEFPPPGNDATHNGGAMQFAPDGTLLVGVGDHSMPTTAQNMNSLFGKVLRINPDGSIPLDNPFYDTATGANRAIWALGVRNPFTMSVQPGTGRLFINDVGQAEWEEINEGAPGANYGWSTTEGPFDPATYPQFTNAVYAYDHTEGAAVTGGVFYNPQAVQFPAEYAGQYFFGDFVTGFIRRMNPDTRAVTPFATDAQGLVDLDVGADGSLYWLSRYTNSVYKIRATSAPDVAAHPQSQLITTGGPVTFAVRASGQAPLTYQWQRNGIDIPGATAAEYQIAAASLDDSGATFRCVIANALGSTMSNTATLTVTADQPPVPTILTPSPGDTFKGGQNFTFSGAALDNEDGALPESAMTWWVDFHHGTHIHPFLAPVTGASSGAFEVPVLDHGAADVWYRINLSVTDSAGFTRIAHRDIRPQLSTITLQTNYPGLQIALDAQPRNAPIVLNGIVNMQRTLSAPLTQKVGGVSYRFVSWSNGGADTHMILHPEAGTTYTATYEPYTEYWLSDRDWTSYAGNPPQRDTNQWGADLLVDGVKHARGLGVNAGSVITYALGGAFERFLSRIGRDDTGDDNGSVTFEVWVDGVKKYDSGVMLGSTPGRDIDIDVTGADELTLKLTDANDGPGYDEADWASARLFNPGAATPDAPRGLVAAAPRYNRVNLAWDDQSTNEASFVIERSADGGATFAAVASVPADTRTFIDAYREGGVTYHYRVRAVNAIGTSAATAPATTVTPPSTLPAPWAESDLGATPPALAGSVTYDPGAGAYTLSGAGTAIGAEADAAHFVHQLLAGDGTITARLDQWLGENYGSATAGLMIRESLNPQARSASLIFSETGPTYYLARGIPGGESRFVGWAGPDAGVRWLRLVRAGNTFSAFTSADGVTFDPFGTPTEIAMGGGAVYAGLVVTSANINAQSNVRFDHVEIANPVPTVVSPPLATPGATTAGMLLGVLGGDDAGEGALTYTWSTLMKPAGAPDPLFASNGTNAAKQTSATFGRAGVYGLRVRISDGARFVDATLDVTVSQALTTVAVTPSSVTVAAQQTLDFHAVALDQFGDALAAQPVFTWAVTTGGGTVDAQGVYAAPAMTGTATVTASVAGHEASGSAAVSIAVPPPAIVNAPAATPDPVAGIAANLSVLASSPFGDEAVSYTWALTAAPAGAAVTYDRNGSNAARNSTVTFDRAGQYTFTVTIFDGHGTITAAVSVVVAQTLTTLSISAPDPLAAPGQAQTLAADARDQFGDPLAAAPQLEWSIVSGGGTIAPAGQFIAAQTDGPVVIKAQASGDPAVSDIVTIVVDGTAPTATWHNDPAPADGATEWLLHVTYGDLSPLDLASIGNDDLAVTAPSGTIYHPSLVSVGPSDVSGTRVAEYRLVPAGGTFNSSENGTWTVELADTTIRDIAGNANAAATLGTAQFAAPFATLAGGTLVLNGTVGDDLLALRVNNGGNLKVTLNGQHVTFDAAIVTDIRVQSFAGTDTLEVAGLDGKSLEFRGDRTTLNVTGGSLALTADLGALSAGGGGGGGGGGSSGPGAALHVAAGSSVTFAAHQRLASLDVQGDARIAGRFTVGASALILGPGAGLDVGAGALIVHGGNPGTATNGQYDALSGALASGFNEGAWTGPGIRSAAAADRAAGVTTGPPTTLGIARAVDVLDLGDFNAAVWNGQTVTSDSILICYTNYGDANLDGAVDGGDYAWIDAYVGTADPAYNRGDFNLDGFVDGGDYAYIDVNVGATPA